MTEERPIAVFDSGLGGISVARDLRAQAPEEPILYLADTRFCPYGDRPFAEIRERSLLVGSFLVERGAKALVVACNSASGAALEALRENLSVPVVGMEPAVKPAAAATRNGRVGVMATAATLSADRYERLMHAHAREIRVTGQACPGLVELVERGETEGDRVREVLQPLLGPLREAGVDTVVLGCTHYPFLREAIIGIMGPDVTLIESGPAVARHTLRTLAEKDARAAPRPGANPAPMRFLTTGDPARVAPAAKRLWPGRLEVEGIAL